MPTNPQTLAGAGARFLRECTDLLHVAVIWASAEAAQRAPNAAKRLAASRGKAYPRRRSAETATSARNGALRALNECSRIANEAVSDFTRFDRTLDEQIKKVSQNRSAFGDIEDEYDFDCCEISEYQHYMRQHQLMLMATLAECHTQLAAYFENFECIYVCEPHPCAPEYKMADARGRLEQRSLFSDRAAAAATAPVDENSRDKGESEAAATAPVGENGRDKGESAAAVTAPVDENGRDKGKSETAAEKGGSGSEKLKPPPKKGEQTG